MGLISKSEEGDKLREKARQHEELADLEDRKQAIREQLEAKQWVSTLPVMSDYEAAMSISKKYNLNSDGKLEIEWSEGNHVSYYDINWLSICYHV